MQYAAYCNSLGYVYFLKSNFSDSRTWLSKGVDACKENPNHDNYKAQLTYCLTNLSNLAIDEGHLEEAENVLSEIQKNISDAPSPKDIVYLYWSLGSLCKRQGKITKAFTHFKKVHELCTANKFSNQASQALGMMAVIYNIQGEFNKAAKIFHKLIDLLEQRGDRRALGDTYGNLAITHLELHDYKNAMKYFKTQLSICTKMNDIHNMCRVNSNMGYTYLEIGNYDKAIIHCNASIKISDEVGIPELRAQATDNIGNVYIQLGDFENAEKYLQETLNIFTDLGNERGIATAKSGLGIIKLEENSLIEAVTFFTDALDVFKKINELTKLARFYLKRGIANQGLKDYDNAENDLNQAERIAIKLDDAGLIFQARLYSVLNDYYKEIRSISETKTALKDLDNKTLRNADKAFLYYQLWLLKGNSNYKKKSCKLYEKLFAVKQSYFFKKYLDLLQ